MIETFDSIKEKGLLVYDYQRGSYVYNLQRPDGQSDIDTAGVFREPIEWLFSVEDYPEQIKDEKGDTVWYTMRKYFILLYKSNPAIIESLLIPEKNIIYVHPVFKKYVLDNASSFMSKDVYITFTKYAMSQIKKARGLNKKIVNPVETRKSIIDFCYTFDEKGYGTVPLKEWLDARNIKMEDCAASRIPNMHNMFAIFHDPFKFNGFIHEDSENFYLTSIPKGIKPICQALYNVEEFSKHCREYHDYQEWLANRNPVRYENYNTGTTATEYDKKNMMHCIRLLHISEEILKTGTANLVCEGDYHDFLMDIRMGKFTYEYMLDYATKYMSKIEDAYSKSKLPDTVDIDTVNKAFYNTYIKVFHNTYIFNARNYTV